MTVQEVAYRISQTIQNQFERNGYRSIDHFSQNYKDVLNNTLILEYEQIPFELTNEFKDYTLFEFFGSTLDIRKKIEWHLDVTSGKRFPLSFSRDIEIRSTKYGSAKVVWEINRLQFLLPLALKYSYSRNEADLELFFQQVTNWIKENPYMTGVNWYSNIEANIRIIVWYFCWQILFQVPHIKENKPFLDFCEQTWLPCIYQHCVYSYSHPSKYSSANNHLVSEYAGLFIASVFWDFKESEKWKKYARKGLEKEIQLQHSINGVNKEEAAEYIQFITDFFLLSVAVGKRHGVEFSYTYNEYLLKICNYIFNLLDIKGNYCKYGDEDDGKVLTTSTNAQFNNFNSILMSGRILFENGAFKGVASDKIDVKNFLLWGMDGKRKLENIQTIKDNRSSFFLRDEGHFIFRKQFNDSEIYMHFDAAPLGYLSIAAHGHADALSLVLHVDGYPFIVDAGTYTYHTEAEWRSYFVSTIAHNTICIDGKNQAQHAADTLWLKHYKAKVTDMTISQDMESVTGYHNGYEKSGCIHKRTVVFNRNNNSFEIRDEIAIKGGTHKIEMPFHLHPSIQPEMKDKNTWVLKNKDCAKEVEILFDQKLSINSVIGQENPKLGWYSSSFLKKQPCWVVRGELVSAESLNLQTIIKINV